MKKAVKQRLRLDREVVATLVSELTAAELRQVAGGGLIGSDGNTNRAACPTGQARQ